MRLLSAAPALLVLLSASCSVQATMTIQPEGPVAVRAALSVPDPTLAAWKGLRDLDPTLPVHPLDPQLLGKGLGPGSTVEKEGSVTTLDFTVPAPRKLLPGLKAGPDLWDVTLDRTAVRKLLSLTAWGQSPALDTLLPAAGTKVTEAEYRDLLVYLLGPGLPEAAARTLVDNSYIELSVVAPRPVKAAALAKSISGNTAFYRWPLVKVLTLDPPIRLRLLF